MINSPYYPIIYLRGYAGTQGEVEDTVSTPYTGFNLGSTRIRQLHTGQVQPHVFESPVIRLMKDHGYVDAYRDGHIIPPGPVCPRSIWIFRYYDVADEDFGDGNRREIEFHAEKLSEFLQHVREAVRDPNDAPAAHNQSFRAYLVAHSMGGLIVRCYLQNPNIPDIDGLRGDEKRASNKGVDKVFTCGTPHGGITFRRGLGWIEGMRDFIDPNNAGNFGSARMREFLALPSEEDTERDNPKVTEVPLNTLNDWFPAERFFCLVGTDARDYAAAAGLSKRAVGPLSDGLVQIANASVLGAPRSYVHRSHSGPYGLVNSESGYQNLQRFLFGEWRVLIEMTDVTVTLPAELQERKQNGARVRASYHVETVVVARGLPVELNRRVYDEDSAAFRSYERLTGEPTKLFTAFLIAAGRVKKDRESLGFALRLSVRVPEYEVDRKLFPDDHYEGAILFADKLNIEVTPRGDGSAIEVRYGWDSVSPNRSPLLMMEGDDLIGTTAFSSHHDVDPRIGGDIRLTVSPWS